MTQKINQEIVKTLVENKIPENLAINCAAILEKQKRTPEEQEKIDEAFRIYWGIQKNI